MGVNSLPKTVTRQRRDCYLNLGPSVPESSTLTTRFRYADDVMHGIRLYDSCYGSHFITVIFGHN